MNEVILCQIDEKYHRQGSEKVRLEVTTRGMIIIDLNVTGRPSTEGHDSLAGSLFLLEDDISACLKSCFAFVGAFYQDRDPYLRYDRMTYNVALSGIGMRKLMAKAPQGGSYQMGNHGDAPVNVFDTPRLIKRADFKAPGRETEAVLDLFRRRLR